MSSTTNHSSVAPTQQPAGIATASLVLGIVGFFIGICSVIGLILGLIARGKVKRGEIGPARVKAGIIASAVTLGLNIIGGIIIIAVLAGGAASTTEVDSAPAATVSEEPAEVVEPAPADESPAAAETVVPTTEAAPAPAAAAPVGDGAVSDGDWSAADIQLEDSFGSFGGTIRLTGPDAAGALVQLTVLSGGSVVATLSGASTDFSGTETVNLLSSDDYAAGDYDYELKVTSY